jgi:hypothetical protein
MASYSYERTTPAPIPSSLSRNEMRQARFALIRKSMEIPRARVEPTDDKYRVIRHPNGARFYATGSSEWPLDSFTTRRLRDGDITLAGESQPEPAAPA